MMDDVFGEVAPPEHAAPSPWDSGSRVIKPASLSPSQSPWDAGSKSLAPGDVGKTLYGVDFDRDVPAVRADINLLPEHKRDGALNAWADHYVANENKQRQDSLAKMPKDVASEAGAVGDIMDMASRAVPRGTFIGPFLDEIDAGSNAALHAVSGGHLGAPYAESLAYQRAKDRAYDKANPKASLAGHVVGALGSGVGVLKAPATTALGKAEQALIAGPAPFIAPAQTTLGTLAQLPTVGAGYGAVAGFGNGEGDLATRLEGAEHGAKVGAVVGTVLPAAVWGGARAYNGASDAIGAIGRRLSKPEVAADKIIIKKLADIESSPGAVAADLAQGQNSARLDSNSVATLPETIADTSDAMRRLTGSVYRQGGKGAEDTKAALDFRQRGPDNPYAPRPDEPLGQLERVRDTFRRVLGITSSKSAIQTQRSMLDAQKAEGDRLYTLARDQSETFNLGGNSSVGNGAPGPIDALALRAQDYPGPFAAKLQEAADLFTRPVSRGAAAREDAIIDKIRMAAEDEQRRVARLVDSDQIARVREDFSVKQQRLMESLNNERQRNALITAQRRPIDDVNRFDASKQALDDMIEGADGNLKRQLVNFKHELLDRVHEYDGKGNATKNIPYQNARDAWGSRAENSEAIDLGRKALTENSEVSADQFKSLTKGQQKLFRIGLDESLNNALGGSKPGTDVTQLFQTRRVRDLMNEVIPVPKSSGSTFADRPERFGDVMAREQRMVQTRNEAMGNSKTAQRGNDDEMFNNDAATTLFDRFKSMNVKDFILEEIANVGRQMFGYRTEVANELAKKLLMAGPAEQQAYLAQLQKQVGPDKFKAFMDELTKRTNVMAGAGADVMAPTTRPPEKPVSALPSPQRSAPAPAAPPQQTAPPAPKPIPNREQLLQKAREAIAKGAPRERVIERLQSKGVDAREL